MVVRAVPPAVILDGVETTLSWDCSAGIIRPLHRRLIDLKERKTVIQPAHLKSGIHIAGLLLGALLFAPFAAAVPPGTHDEIHARLQPDGSVCRKGDDCGTAAAAVATGPLSGDQVYNQYCFACHATGVSGAPTFGNVEQWKPRAAKGIDELLKSSINGLNAMPAKGTCVNCSDDDIKAAVQYMLDSSAG